MPRSPHDIAADLLTLYNELPQIDVLDDNLQAAELAHTWYARVWHTVKATLLLHQQGFVVEAAPLRRSLIEHALALQWIGHAPGPAYDAVVKIHQHSVRTFAAKPESAGISREAVDRLLRAELGGGSQQYLTHVYELCRAYGPPGAYVGWFYETGGSHASWRSGQPYRQQRRITADSVQDAMVVLWLALATAGFSLLLRGDPWASAAAAADRELGEEGGPLFGPAPPPEERKAAEEDGPRT